MNRMCLANLLCFAFNLTVLACAKSDAAAIAALCMTAFSGLVVVVSYKD